MKQNSRQAQKIRELKKATIAARMPQIEQEGPSKSFLSSATKAKISAAALAVTTLFTGLSATSCDNGTSPTTIPDENHIGTHGGIEVRVAPGVDAVHGQEALTRLQLSPVELIQVVNPGGIVRVIEITGPATTSVNVISAKNGIVRGTVHEGSDGILGLVTAGILQMAMIYDSNTNTIRIVGTGKDNQRG